MEVKAVHGNHILIQGDSGSDYDVDLVRGCPCRWGTFRLGKEDRVKECKHLVLAKHISLMRI